MITRTASNGTTAATELAGPRSALVRMLTEAYRGEIQTVSTNALSCTYRDGIRAERIASCMREAIGCDLDHAQRLAVRIRRLYGPVPGPADFSELPTYLRVPPAPVDNVTALAGLIEAETAAVARYRRIAAVASDAFDWATQALVLQLIREKETCLQSLRRELSSSQKS